MKFLYIFGIIAWAVGFACIFYDKELALSIWGLPAGMLAGIAIVELLKGKK